MVIDKSKLEQTASKLGLRVYWNSGKPGKPGYYSGSKYIPFEDLMYKPSEMVKAKGPLRGNRVLKENKGLKNMDITEKIVKSEQFKYSEKILDLRYDNGLSLHDMVNISGLTKSEYLRLEACDISLGVEEYVSVINKVEEYIDSIKEDK